MPRTSTERGRRGPVRCWCGPRDVEILPPEVIPLVTPQPYVSFALALQAFYPWPVPEPGRHESAMVAESVTLHPTARLEPGVVVYPGAMIGAHVHVGAHSVIGRGVSIGEGTVVGPNCTLMKVTIGAQCVLHPGVCIGQDGFGFAVSGEAILKVPQVGGVRIGNMVEIGANTTIDCGALGDTVIDDMVKIDNQVQIAHNVRIGKGSRIVAQAGIAGSATLGAWTVIGGQVGIVGHIALADRVMVAAGSGVSKTVGEIGAVVAGRPAEPIQQWRKRMAVITRLTRQAVLRHKATHDDEPSGDA